MHKQTLFLMALSGRSIAWPEGDPRAAKPLLMKSTFKEKKNKQKSLILQNPGTETTRLNETKIEKKRSQIHSWVFSSGGRLSDVQSEV